jgi:DNA-binding NtrC family response regulator
VSPDGLASLLNYHWPGNVRELRNYIQRAFILADTTIDASTLAPMPIAQSPVGLTLSIPVGTSLAEVDRKLIYATLELCGGVKKRAADVLGISLKTLYNRLEEYGLQGNVPPKRGEVSQGDTLH